MWPYRVEKLRDSWSVSGVPRVETMEQSAALMIRPGRPKIIIFQGEENLHFLLNDLRLYIGPTTRAVPRGWMQASQKITACVLG